MADEQQQTNDKAAPVEKPADPVKPVPEPVKENQTPPAAADETVEQVSSEAMAKLIEEKLKKINRTDYVTITMNRTGLIFGVGILLILLWLMPVIDFGLIKLTGGQISLSDFTSETLFLTKPAETPAATAETEAEPIVKIRIKTNDDSLTKVNRVEMKLRQAGFNYIETVYDQELTNEGLLIATRDSNQKLQEELSALFKDAYLISSESAALTDDSDFAAAILIDDEAEMPASD